MESEFVDTISLANGLKLEIRDASRKVAGDRWRVELVATIHVPISEDWFRRNLSMPASIDTLKEALGDTVGFEYKTVRNFIDEHDKSVVFDQMKAGLAAHLNYYEHPDFAARLIIKKYSEIHKRQFRMTFSQ